MPVAGRKAKHKCTPNPLSLSSSLLPEPVQEVKCRGKKHKHTCPCKVTKSKRKSHKKKRRAVYSSSDLNDSLSSSEDSNREEEQLSDDSDHGEQDEIVYSRQTFSHA